MKGCMAPQVILQRSRKDPGLCAMKVSIAG